MAESTGTAGCGAAGLAVLTNGLPCVDVDDKARGLVPTQDLVLSWKGNITVTAMPGEQAVWNKEPREQEDPHSAQPGTTGLAHEYTEHLYGSG